MNKRLKESIIGAVLVYIVIRWVMPAIDFVLRFAWNALKYPYTQLVKRRKAKKERTSEE